MLAAESPEVYAITSRGFMPAIFIRWENGLEVVRPVNSRREYSFHPDNVLSAADGEAAMKAQRQEAVLSNYSFTLIARGSLRANGKAIQVFRVSHPVDLRRSYVVTVGAALNCTCEAFKKAQIGSCKHCKAAEEYSKQQEAVAAAPFFPAEPYQNPHDANTNPAETPAKRPVRTYTKEEWTS